MKKTLFGAALIISLAFTGCNSVPNEALGAAADNALITDGFTLLMEEGKTTRKQEQAFVLANRKAWHSQNFALNGAPLPEDLTPGMEDRNLLKILREDPRVRAKMRELEGAIAPIDTTTPEGN